MLESLPLVLRLIATLACAVAAVAIWTGPAWLVWVALFPGAVLCYELYTVLRGGTLSGHVWALRADPVLLSMLLGSAAVTVAFWLGVWHFWIERDFLPRLQRTYVDDGVLGLLVLAGTLLTGLWARARRK